MAITHHDAYRVLRTQNQSYATASAGQFSTTTNAFSSQTYWIRLCAIGNVTATNQGVRYWVGEAATVTATSTSALLPLNWVEYVKVTPGQKVAAVSDGAVTGSLNVVELGD